jgi:hypothetical protein
VLGRAQECVLAQFSIAHATLQIEPPGWEESQLHD